MSEDGNSYTGWPVKLANPDDEVRFAVGMSIVLTFRPRWYRRAWAWFKRVVLRRRPPPPRWLTVVGVDREAGSITVEGPR